MDILLKGVTVIDPSSPFHHQTTDIFIQAGFIAEIGATERTAEQEFKLDGMHVSTGWVDVFANFCDPGFEFKETLQTGAAAAAAGGFTDVLLVPNSAPPLDNRSAIENLLQRGSASVVNLHPMGAVSKKTEGKLLAEMYDMHHAGAVAFTDGFSPIQSAGLLLKALQYLKTTGKTLIQLPNDETIFSNGLINEGIISTQLGLPGKPALAEELIIARDLALAKYGETKIHFTGISTAKSVEMIRKAKQEGLTVTCSVTPYHLYFTDADLVTYDANLKLTPPLRTATDRAALRNGISDGTIDCIASHHQPQHLDQKNVEFEYAENGMAGIETSFAAVRSSLPHLPLEQLLTLFTVAPRSIFNLPSASIVQHQRASLTLYQPDENWTPGTTFSKSKNNAFTGKQLLGKPLGIINKDKLFLRPL